MEKSSDYPEWIDDINGLEKWLNGYEFGRFDPRDAVTNLLSPKGTERRGFDSTVYEISADVIPKGIVKLSVSFNYIANDAATLEKESQSNRGDLGDVLKLESFEKEFSVEKNKVIEDFKVGTSGLHVSLACIPHGSKLTVVLSNKAVTRRGIDVDSDSKNAVETIREKITRWNIEKWLLSAFSVSVRIKCVEGFEIMPDNLSKISYLCQQGTLCRTKNTGHILISHNEIELTSLPHYEEQRFLTWGTNSEELKFKNLGFEADEKTIFEHLKSILSIVKTHADRVKSAHVARAKGDARYEQELNLSLAGIDQELASATLGLTKMQDDPDALWAFKFLNETMSRRGGRFSAWFPFQLVFILICIGRYPSAGENSPLILNFPTGMGKTESFLGHAIWIAAYQRKTRGNLGTVAVIKYPRVMLSKQQALRAFDLISHANEVICGLEDRNVGKTPFSVGVLYGKADTPNKIVEAQRGGDFRFSREFENVSMNIRKNKRNKLGFDIKSCPECGSEVEISAEKDSGRIRFTCRDPKCVYQRKAWNGGSIFERTAGEMPIYTTDDEVFRYSPTIIITTVYKFTTFCNTGRWKTILGRGNSFLTDTRFGHCYYRDDKEAIENLCEDKGLPNWFSHKQIDQNKFGTPSLIVFDETHLVTGAQAGLLGPVETAFIDIIKNGSGRYPQVISSSATLSKRLVNASVRAYQRHTSQIFGCHTDSVTLFPSELEIYKSNESENQRRVVAIYPGIQTQRFVNEKITSYLINRISNEKSEFYRIPVYYFQSKSEMHKNNKNLEDRVANNLKITDMNRRVFEFSADVSAEEIQAQLENLEESTDWGLALATNTIANGIDSNKFNIMVFNGLPSSTAEYVQARSRIARVSGRKGLAILILSRYSPREKTFLERFSDWHINQEFLYEENPINKYSEGIIEDTIPRLIHLHSFWNGDKSDSKVYTTAHMLAHLSDELVSGSCESSVARWITAPGDTPELSATIRDKVRFEITEYIRLLKKRKQNTIYDFESKSDDKNTKLPKISVLQVSDNVNVRLADHETYKLMRLFDQR